MANVVFYVLLAFIWAVSARDMYWSITLQDVLYEYELNPVGRWLIELDSGSIALFMALKLFGTCFVTCALISIYRLNTIFGMATLIGVAVAMAALLVMLEM